MVNSVNKFVNRWAHYNMNRLKNQPKQKELTMIETQGDGFLDQYDDFLVYEPNSVENLIFVMNEVLKYNDE